MTPSEILTALESARAKLDDLRAEMRTYYGIKPIALLRQIGDVRGKIEQLESMLPPND